MYPRLDESYDIVIIGAGSTGAGIALDASSRGYKTLILDKNDFASGTSSKSSKLIHGGVRYLEKAVKKLDKSQFDLVKEGLAERAIFLNNAPHLAKSLKLNTPVYSWKEAFYISAGLFLYKLISFSKSIGSNAFLNKDKISKLESNIKQKNLKGAVSFYDGRFLDSRKLLFYKQLNLFIQL